MELWNADIPTRELCSSSHDYFTSELSIFNEKSQRFMATEEKAIRNTTKWSHSAESNTFRMITREIKDGKNVEK